MATVVAQPTYIAPQTTQVLTRTTQVVQQNQVAVMPSPYQTLML